MSRKQRRATTIHVIFDTASNIEEISNSGIAEEVIALLELQHGRVAVLPILDIHHVTAKSVSIGITPSQLLTTAGMQCDVVVIPDRGTFYSICHNGILHVVDKATVNGYSSQSIDVPGKRPVKLHCPMKGGKSGKSGKGSKSVNVLKG